MKTTKWIVAGCLLVVTAALFLSCARCTSKPPPVQCMNIEKINALTNMHIRFEELRGQIYVTTVDRFGDGHMFYVEHDGLSKEKTLNLLKAKQQELDKVK